MSKHLHSELEQLKKRILHLSALVEESVRRSVRAVVERDLALATAVIAGDDRIDQLEVEIEEECLKLLALYQPVATDLRFVIAVLKINNDLERIGDLGVNIAQRAEAIVARAPVELDLQLPLMAGKAQTMLRHALDSLVNLDPELARRVCDADDEVDELNRSVAARVKEAALADPRQLDPLVHLLLVARHIERIADQATNIAEDVIYMVEGEIIRHRQRNPGS
jgi:phosphate transport system protein